VWPTSGYVSRLSEQLANYHSKHGVLCFLKLSLGQVCAGCLGMISPPWIYLTRSERFWQIFIPSMPENRRCGELCHTAKFFTDHLLKFAKFYLANLVFLPTSKKVCQIKKSSSPII
jgi:hypothetical protein